MSHWLKGKSIVIIGGTSGIGLAAARAFVDEGARVVVVGIDKESTETAARLLPVQTAVLRGDATDASEPLAFQAFWLRDGVVEAAMHVNLWDTGVAPLEALVGKRVDPVRLADTSVPFDQLGV
jgi:NAD(P)-dependent dehydrogenase (short-subunit alcohol dehydrogenase family)